MLHHVSKVSLLESVIRVSRSNVVMDHYRPKHSFDINLESDYTNNVLKAKLDSGRGKCTANSILINFLIKQC